MPVLARFLHFIDILNEWIGRAFSSFTLVLMCIVVYDTGMRYIFNNPPIWGMDLNKIVLLTIVCLGGGYCLLHGGHVRVDIIYYVLPQRVRAAFDLFTYLFLLAFCAVVIKYGGSLFWEAWQSGEVSSESAWEYPLWPILMLIPLSGILLGIQTIAKWIRDVVILLTGENRLESKVVKGEGGLRG
jgi:TRAP-type mannitol/chloroaromatic compound transport system permease small subunit